jgi:hypothetical protein
MQTHKTLIDQLKHSDLCELLALFALKEKTFHERISFLDTLVKKLWKPWEPNDEQSCTLIKWLLHAIKDRSMTYTLGGTDTQDEGVYKIACGEAAEKVANHAWELWCEIPKFRIVPTLHGRHTDELQYPTLSNTKGLLFEAITDSWATANHESVAECQLKRLATIEKELDFSEERKMFYKAVKDASDRMQEKRLLQEHIMLSEEFADTSDELRHLLVTAWARNNKHNTHFSKQIGLLLRAKGSF